VVERLLDEFIDNDVVGGTFKPTLVTLL